MASPYLLNGLTKCGHCGKSLVAQAAKSGEFPFFIYGSLNKKGAVACMAKYLNAPTFKALVLEQNRTLILSGTEPAGL